VAEKYLLVVVKRDTESPFVHRSLRRVRTDPRQGNLPTGRPQEQRLLSHWGAN
jgi:hypothetical protein